MAYEFVPTTCQWIGSAESEGGIGCNETVLPEKSYCHRHYYMVYERGTSKKTKREIREFEKTIDELNATATVDIDNDLV